MSVIITLNEKMFLENPPIDVVIECRVGYEVEPNKELSDSGILWWMADEEGDKEVFDTPEKLVDYLVAAFIKDTEDSWACAYVKIIEKESI